jgi:hypothetical protein
VEQQRFLEASYYMAPSDNMYYHLMMPSDSSVSGRGMKSISMDHCWNDTDR